MVTTSGHFDHFAFSRNSYLDFLWFTYCWIYIYFTSSISLIISSTFVGHGHRFLLQIWGFNPLHQLDVLWAKHWISRWWSLSPCWCHQLLEKTSTLRLMEWEHPRVPVTGEHRKPGVSPRRPFDTVELNLQCGLRVSNWGDSCALSVEAYMSIAFSEWYSVCVYINLPKLIWLRKHMWKKRQRETVAVHLWERLCFIMNTIIQIPQCHTRK